MTRALISIGLLLYALGCLSQDVVINEFMADNQSTLQDEDGDYSDWIELYNTTETAIDLSGFSLTDDPSIPEKWSFPEVHIDAQGYLLIFASDKDRSGSGELHTNFKISAGGEVLQLSDAAGVLIDETEPSLLSPERSLGRVPDGSNEWLSIDSPTPMATNDYSDQLTFTVDQGFYPEPFTLSIAPAAGDTLYCTFDGSVPTVGSLLYSGSIEITDKSSEPNELSEIPTTPDQEVLSHKAWESPSGLIGKATVLRCAAFHNGVRSSAIYSKTYFVGPEVNASTLPVISLITPAENLFDPDSGIYVPGQYYDPNDPELSGNYFQKGSDWERAVHIEYFDVEGALGFAQNAGMRIHGAKTRHASQKTLRLYAREEYGQKHFNYPILPQRSIDRYKRFLLRTSMGSWGGQTIIKDVLAQRLSRSLDVDQQEFQPALVYINGEYWGVHTIRDRIDERYIEYLHGVPKDSVESNTESQAYGQLMDFVEKNDLSDEEHYGYVLSQIDLSNYIDYTLAQLFLSNRDWPANNLKAWRKISDGKWRWILYDLDDSFGDAKYKMLEHATKNDPTVIWPNSPASTLLFRRLIENKAFEEVFVDRFDEVLSTVYGTDLTLSLLDSIQGIYSPEIPRHIRRWNYPTDMATWHEDIELTLRDFLKERPCAMGNEIIEFFSPARFEFNCRPDVVRAPSVILAPNPSSGRLALIADGIALSEATITICNTRGQDVYLENGVALMSGERRYLDLQFLADDVYILQLTAPNYSEAMKFVIAR